RARSRASGPGARALVAERCGEEQEAEPEERRDAPDRFERREVDDENLPDCEPEQRKPAQAQRPHIAGEARDERCEAESGPEGGEGELRGLRRVTGMRAGEID